MPKLSLFLLALAALAPARAEETATPTVTVAANKEAVVRKLDRTVYDAASQPRAANGSAQDVLQATPDVAVTADGQIAVKGNRQVTVLVDGKPAAMLSGSAEERAVALQTMSGADIASVEVITNPSAAFAANGGAIVNIVLKKNRKPGAHAQAQGSATDRGLWNAGASGDVTRQGVSMHGSLALRHDGTLKMRGSEVDWNNPANGEGGRLLQSSTVFVRRTVRSAALGVDAAVGDTGTISLAARYNDRHSRPLFDVLNDSTTGAAETRYHRISDGPNEQSDGSASASYSRRGSDTALKAMLQHGTTHALVDKSWRDVFVLPVRAPSEGRAATRLARRLDQGTLDWSRAGEQGQWGVGLDVQRKVDAMGNHLARIDVATGAEAPDPRTTNDYAVTTTLAAAYLTAQFRRGRWEALLGGRAERMALRVDPAPGAARTGRWQAFDPSLHLRYAADDAVDITFSHRRSLQMPDPRDLNPFTTYVDAQNLSRGNPELAPQRVRAWEAGVDAHGPRLRGSLGAFHRASSDTVVDARSVAGDVLVTTRRNGGQARSTGITGSLDWTTTPALTLGLDAGAYRVTLGASALSGYVNLRASWHAGGDDVALDAHGQSAGITPLGRYGPTSSVNVTWKRKLDKLLSLTVNANDIFDGSRRTYALDTPTFRQAGFDHFVARRIYVGFVRKFE